MSRLEVLDAILEFMRRRREPYKKFAAFITTTVISACAYSAGVDKFDLQVCDALKNVEESLACYTNLKITDSCNTRSGSEKLKCLKQFASTLVSDSEAKAALAAASNAKFEQAVASVEQKARDSLPLNLSIRGYNYNATATVGKDCIFRGQMELDAGPNSAHLSLMQMTFGSGAAYLRCKEGRKCALATDTDAKYSKNSKLVRTSSIAVAHDFSPYPESTDAVERIARALNYCQKVAPTQHWNSRFESVPP